jgi:MinD-like ATPase involved in chromosome partitioning or flagellar assembly
VSGDAQAPGSPVIDGRPAPVRAGRRLRWQAARLLRSSGHREEAELERRLRSPPDVTRPNVVAVVSPQRRVGSTTATFVLGSLLSSHAKLRAVAVDAGPGSGGLAPLSPTRRRAQRSLAQLLDDLERLHTAAQLNRYVSRPATGLHILAKPPAGGGEAGLDRDRCGELVAFLSSFYDVVLLDVGIGVAGTLGEFARERADQHVLVTTPESMQANATRRALATTPQARTTVMINKSRLRSAESEAIEEQLRAEHPHLPATIPCDEHLAGMLRTATYTLAALQTGTRVAVKRLGVAVGERLV